ncbi:Rhs-family protein [Minicystis rosea]|nr:Rhs-family protein [Minicystis rosea]
MGTTIGGKDIATTGSGHVSPGPPATSLIPPTPPAGLVPAPFPYVASSSSATGTSDRLTVGGKPVLVEGSAMDVERPGNQPAAPPGAGDVLTHVVCGKAVTTSGSSKVKAGGKGVCATGDSTVLGVPSPCGKVAQSNGRLIAAVDYNASGADYAAMAAVVVTVGEPVAVVTGEVVDDMVDLALPGLIPVEWKRLYCSGRHRETTPLGRGGWTHALHQWIEVSDERVTMRNDDGRNVLFALPTLREPVFHRCKRLRLSLLKDGSFEVYSLDTRLTRRFARLDAGDARAMLREIRNAWGNRIELVYDGAQLVRIIDTAGRELRLSHDEAGRIVRVDAWAQGQTRQTVRYTYDAHDGDLVATADALGHAERYAYDAWHRMTEKTLTNGVRFFYEYDPETGRCRKTWGDSGLHTVALDVDVAKRSATCHGNEEPRKYTWNEQGAVLREETYDGSWLVEKEYDADLHVTAERNAAGETTAHAYDELGNRVQTTDAAGNVTRWRFDGDVLMERIGPDGLSTKYEHDMRGVLVEVTYPSGETFALEHDARGRVVGVLGPEGRLSSFLYDEQHNLIAETDARGATWRYAYDPLGRPIARTDPLGRMTHVTLDALGHTVAIYHADGTETRVEYDARGNVTKCTDALGRVTTMQYAGTGSLVKQTTPDGRVWDFEYDTIERLTRIQNPLRETYEFEYDRAGRICEEKTFDERRFRYQYNLAGRLSRLERPDETWRAFHYDALGNLVHETSSHGAQVFERDDLGRLLRATVIEHNGKTVVSIERDRLGRVIAVQQGGRTLRHELDARGRHTARVLPNGETTRYQYDVMGALIAVEHCGQRVEIERDVLGRETKRRVNGSVEIESQYDAMDRLLEQRATATTPAGAAVHDVLVQRSWRYDRAGRVLSIGDKRWGRTLYDYDDAGQLIQARRGAHREVFDYDPTGSLQAVLKTLDEREMAPPWDVSTGNVLTATKDTEFTNDKNGRRRTMRDRATGAVTEYLWDCRDRLREVRLPDGRRALYIYDAFGRRVRKEIVPRQVVADLARGDVPATHVVEFLWDGDALAAEYDSEHGVRVHVHEGPLVPMLQAEHGEVFVVVCDHLGMPKELLGQDGKVAWAAAHSAWGRVVEVKVGCAGRRARPVESPFRLLGQYADDETGLCYTRFRYFDPATGRWCSPDPLGIFGGRNLNAFDGSPSNDVDPLGLECRRDNFLRKVRGKDLSGAPPFGKDGQAGHARSKHGVDPDDAASVLNSPDRIFSGVNKNGRPVDIYVKGGNVVITEAGNKTSVITAYGSFATKGGSSPVDPEKWANPANWDPGARYAEIQASERGPLNIIYPNTDHWHQDWY